MIILGINEQSDAAHFIGDADAPGGGTQEQRSTKTASLNCLIDGEAAETENWHVVAGEAFFDQRRRATVFELSWTQRVETKNPRGRVGHPGPKSRV